MGPNMILPKAMLVLLVPYTDMVGPWTIKNSGGVTDVEPVDPSTLQFSTLVEVRVRIVG